MISIKLNNLSQHRPNSRNHRDLYTFIVVLVVLNVLHQPPTTCQTETFPSNAQLLDCRKLTNHSGCTTKVDRKIVDSNSADGTSQRKIETRLLARYDRQVDNETTSSSSSYEPSNTVQTVSGPSDKCNSINGFETQETSYVCTPNNLRADEQQRNQLESGDKVSRIKDKNWKPLEVYLEPLEYNTTQLPIGTSFSVKCRFNATTLDQDLRFKLKWFRSVSQGLNQSILPTPTDPKVSITTSRVSVLQRNGGLDLEVREFQLSDSGEYFCQAISDDDQIIDEKRVQFASRSQLKLIDGYSMVDGSDVQSVAKDGSTLSQENLSKLLPSLRVIPNYVDAMPGETIRLSCVTTDDQDPEPSAGDLSWSFEPFDRRTPFRVWRANSAQVDTLPSNVVAYGNLLVVSSFSDEQRGFYKCTYKIPDFDLTIQASGELSTRPLSDSAPLVSVSPELVRLSSDGSIKLQCESTGFPAPSLTWYRLDGTNLNTTTSNIDGGAKAEQSTSTSPLDKIDGIQVTQVDARDSMAYCEHNAGTCSLLKNNQTQLVSALSFVHIKHARAQHQGQYVCRASNKYGSNQASALVDVEFREQPRVSIEPPETRQQTIELPVMDFDMRQPSSQMVYTTFRCTLGAGRPKPRLRWLRPALPSSLSTGTSSALLMKHRLASQFGDMSSKRHLALATAKLHQSSPTSSSSSSSASFEIYDLTRGVSSATSKVSTWLEDNGRTIALSIGTISTDDEGDYVCLAENEAGSHSTVARLIVRRAAQVRIQQPSPQLARPGQSFQLDCIASGHPAPLDIEWSRSDKGAYFSLIARQSSSTSSASTSSSIPTTTTTTTVANYNQSNGNSLAPLAAQPITATPITERAILKFDRVTFEDSGEYTCNARDPLNENKILQDTIMVLVEEPTTSLSSQSSSSSSSMSTANESSLSTSRHLPFAVDDEEQLKLMVRPTKLNVPIGSNVTLDCLAVGGLQPTVVEWLAPPLVSTSTSGLALQADSSSNPFDLSKTMAQARSSLSLVQPYYRGPVSARPIEGSWAFQFGSKLRIFNISRAHEGVYQCKGRNKVGTESAPALISLTDRKPVEPAVVSSVNTMHHTVGETPSDLNKSMEPPAIKTKIAKAGSNIELRCQVNGVGQQPATSWSRDGLELPAGSVQIEHNLWIRNLTLSDEGLYVCSARSDEPNRIIQARIHLLVRPATDSADTIGLPSARPLDNLRAKVVASKLAPKLGDSITLECIIEQIQMNGSKSVESSVDLGSLERQVLWTNLHSGESLFQDNVYVQDNLLIIYSLKYENEATYRCNFNELTQHVDFKLLLADHSHRSRPQQQSGEFVPVDNNATNSRPDSTDLSARFPMASNGRHIELRSVPIGSRLVLDCANTSSSSFAQSKSYKWFRVQGRHLIESNSSAGILIIESVSTSDASVYNCFEMSENHRNASNLIASTLVQVQTVAAKFTQKPLSFVTLPAISNSDQRLELELKFLPERSHGLVLFSGPQQQQQQQQQQPQAASQVTSGGPPTSSDFILLGLQRGHLEFRFELGDGVTTVRSDQNLTLNQWHKVVIERYRRTVSMWVDGHAAVSNSSGGKFFNLNLDSVLYVGGSQFFADLSAQDSTHLSVNESNASIQRVGPTSRFYGYSSGFYGCIASLRINRRAPVQLLAHGRSVSVGVFECDRSECGRGASGSGSLDCGLNGVCQVDRSVHLLDKQRASLVYSDLRCICAPNFVGDQCDADMSQQPLTLLLPKPPGANSTHSPVAPADQQQQQRALHLNKQRPPATGACKLLSSISNASPCSQNGTLECESLTSTSFKCHCRLGYMGDLCDQVWADFNSSSEFDTSSVWFQAPAYLQLKLNNATEAEAAFNDANQLANPFNSTMHTRQISMSERQNITFNLRTRSSFGLLFYVGAHLSGSAQTSDFAALSTRPINGSQVQGSKSMVANLLARLSQPPQSVVDYLAVALIDGHIELSYELGSGLAIIRSSRRFNDNQWHKITILRDARLGRLSVDDEMRFEGASPGKLSMLNGIGTNEIYFGGLPIPNDTTVSHLSGAFDGCIAQVYLNELGPLALVRSDFRAQVQSSRNLAPCSAAASFSSAAEHTSTTQTTPEKIARKGPQQKHSTTTTSSSSDSLDDSDET